MSNWTWQDFEYISSPDRMDGRRAAFLLHDFVNMFEIDDFRVIETDGEWQSKRIVILYKDPERLNDTGAIEDLWYEHLKQFWDKGNE